MAQFFDMNKVATNFWLLGKMYKAQKLYTKKIMDFDFKN